MSEHLPFAEFEELEHKYVMQTGKHQPLRVVRGEGMHLYDSDGREYLDLMAGIAVNALGHAHPAIVETLVRQAGLLMHSSDLYYTEPKVHLARRLVELAFPSRVFFNNSGAEANETAIKIARKWGKKHKDGAFEIISAFNSFHGRTLAAVTAGGQAKYSKWFEPLPPGFIHVPYNNLAAIKAVTNERTAAVFLEPVIGEGGVIVAEPGYLEGVRSWCDAQDLLLILDEVQTGIGRTGKWFAHQHFGITPDVMTLAKALGGGLPIAAVLAAPRADVLEPGDHGSTFGGNPLACTVALTVLDVIEREHLVENAAEMGDLLQQALADLGQGAPRGLGLMRAFNFAEPVAKAYQNRCIDNGVLVNATDDSTIRVVPPLIISSADIDQAQARMGAALKG
ncbi:MAG: acetylornithine transaminase [Candidatus Dormibacteraeota bacterium]|nr:acetylornithine transaminase [Candidatus Dormibacteraeota bacterium]